MKTEETETDEKSKQNLCSTYLFKRNTSFLLTFLSVNLFRRVFSLIETWHVPSPEFCELFHGGDILQGSSKRGSTRNDFENTALHSLQETESATQHIKQILQ